MEFNINITATNNHNIEFGYNSMYLCNGFQVISQIEVKENELLIIYFDINKLPEIMESVNEILQSMDIDEDYVNIRIYRWKELEYFDMSSEVNFFNSESFFNDFCINFPLQDVNRYKKFSKDVENGLFFV